MERTLPSSMTPSASASPLRSTVSVMEVSVRDSMTGRGLPLWIVGQKVASSQGTDGKVKCFEQRSPISENKGRVHMQNEETGAFFEDPKS
eukprot:1137770-Pelagomonas_calceolata.AAC.13